LTHTVIDFLFKGSNMWLSGLEHHGVVVAQIHLDLFACMAFVHPQAFAPIKIGGGRIRPATPYFNPLSHIYNLEKVRY
jgi:hypothetical protein